jgi:peptidoglycan/xylan/chitin deacetylase (PgdA/CDA1 family)
VAKAAAKFCVSLVLLLIGLWPVLAQADQANVFVYHRFNDARFPSTNISSEDFRAHLELLQANDFTVLTLGEVMSRLDSGRSLPPRCAVITVDDAYQTFLTDGWPLLQRFGFPATLFVSTDTVGGTDYLDWQELRQLRQQGVEIGNHSASHAYLLDQRAAPGWAERVLADIRRAQEAFVEHLGFRPRLFAYPYGEFSPDLITLVARAGFDAAFGQQSGVLTAEQPRYSLPRFPMGGAYTDPAAFRDKLFMKHLPVQVLAPDSTVVGSQNPPRLLFSLAGAVVAAETLRCYIPGQAECRIKKVDGQRDLYAVQADAPLDGRRSKYTLTASDRTGAHWYWYSQLWVLPQ